ncbi:MAG TPA: glycoside hydrolase [Thermoanaerobaculia bacterium]|nr:glycoside hydrolase [Thermoanaerobaculia bacterium]
MRRLLLLLAFALTATAQPYDASRFAEMRWRSIGPFRGGRTVAAVGIPSQPNVFYMGVNNGGVWKTTDAGRTWIPIFDDQPTGSIGALAIAPSDPNIIYVGSGEGLQRPDLSTGDGIYKSSDAGKTWTHLGLRDGQQIPMIAIDPRDPNRLFVAVLGHPYGPNEERGIFRSTDGGATFEKVLYRDENTGGIDVVIDPSNPQIVYAALWEARQGPWENATFRGPGSGVFKSTDGGTTWTQLKNGLPDELSRVGLEVAQADTKRLYAIVNAKKDNGVYRSDDAGATWTRINDDERLWGRDGDFDEIRSDPKNADIVYVANVVTWKSVDGGKTFTSFRGAPGGDDYHRVWINPNDPNILIDASDQGAVITVNGGASWSSWYNQPTAQMFHVNTDNAFPYRVCGGQQESGSACVQSRGDDGRITFREWHPAGVEEYGYAVPDPLDPDVVYGGKITRWDRRTSQVQDITPKPVRDTTYRVVRTQPVVFSPVDPHILYFASNTLWKTANGGKSWNLISPDLTRKEWEVPASVGVYKDAPSAKPTQRGVIYAIAPSPLDAKRIWVGTDDGLIHVTTDGGRNWTNVTPPQLVPWAKVSIMEASHFDASTAYATINTFRLDDLRPHILRTRDGGKSWSEIVSGIPDGGTINVVREDPKKKGLLFAGSEREVYVSFDDGDHWQSLRLNMPATSIRDLVLHEDDVVVGTHGRGFWILDDIEPLRQLANVSGDAFLFKPQRALRIRWNMNTDTPIPPDEPAGQNPPDGAILDYWLASASPVTLEILGADNTVIRRYSSDDPVPPLGDQGNVPWYWIRPQRPLPSTPGMHRVTWDVRYPALPEEKLSYPIAATPADTMPDAAAPWAMPGTYTVRLTANGRTLTQPLVVQMDPRVKTPRADLAQQFALSMRLYEALKTEKDEKRIATLRSLLDQLQSADIAPTAQQNAAVESALKPLSAPASSPAAR